jgi:hypothetical protein
MKYTINFWVMIASILVSICCVVMAAIFWDYDVSVTTYEPTYQDVETRATFTTADNSTVLALTPGNSDIWTQVPGAFESTLDLTVNISGFQGSISNNVGAITKDKEYEFTLSPTFTL